MALKTQPARLSDSYRLTASDVEAAYRPIVQAIGGDVYTNGTPASVAGQLDWRNFHPNAGIKNSSKSSPSSVWTIPLRILSYASGAGGSATVRATAQLPWPQIGLFNEFEATITGWTLAFESISPATASGSAILYVYDSTGTQTQVGTTATLVNPTGRSSLKNESGLSVVVTPKNYLRLSFQITTASVTIKDIVAIVWLKSKHLR